MPWVSATYEVPIIMPIKMADKRNQWLADAFKKTITSNTATPIPKFDRLPKLSALKPPAKSVIPTLINDKPMEVITMPVVNGVIIRFRRVIKRLNNISTKAPAMVKPNNIAKISSAVPPSLFTFAPASSSALINAKLVPCMATSPLPKGPTRLV